MRKEFHHSRNLIPKGSPICMLPSLETLIFQHARPVSCVPTLARGTKFLSLCLMRGDHKSSNSEKELLTSSFPPPSALPLWHPIKTLSICSHHNKQCWTIVGVKTINSRPWVSTGDLEILIKSVFDLDGSKTPNPGWFVGLPPRFPDLPPSTGSCSPDFTASPLSESKPMHSTFINTEQKENSSCPGWGNIYNSNWLQYLQFLPSPLLR